MNWLAPCTGYLLSSWSCAGFDTPFDPSVPESSPQFTVAHGRLTLPGFDPERSLVAPRSDHVCLANPTLRLVDCPEAASHAKVGLRHRAFSAPQ